jgi:hypothetical protein
MILDATLAFVQLGAPLSLVGGAGVAIASNVIDELGSGVGTAPQNIIGTRTLFGADLGVGEKPLIQVNIGTAFTTSNAATLQVAFQGAVDTGAAGGYLPGAWITLIQTGLIPVSQLTLNAVIARLEFAMAVPPSTLPRYLRLLFSPAAATNFTAGTITYAGPTMVRDDYSIAYASKNFVVA